MVRPRVRAPGDADALRAAHSFSLTDSDLGRELVAKAGEGTTLPLVIFPDGTVLRNPSNADLALASGSPVNPDKMQFDVVIVGVGPAGLSAAVYGASEAEGVVGRQVYIVGGANSAGQAALHLSRFAARVTLVVRAEMLGAGMSHYLVQQIEATPNLDVRLQTEVVDGGGDGRLEHLVLRNRVDPGEETVAADALFLMIGAEPRTDWLPNAIRRDPQGFILSGPDVADGEWPLERGPFLFETSMPGVFTAGDVRHGSVKRVASAVGEGSVAIQLLHQFFAADRLAPFGRPRDLTGFAASATP